MQPIRRWRLFDGLLRICAVLCLMLLLAVSASVRARADTLFRFEQHPGPHAVGLKIIEQYDYTRVYRRRVDALGRPYSAERARPLQTLVWYPAERGRGVPMTVRDYLKLWATETSFNKPATLPVEKEWFAGLAPTAERQLWALRDAKPTLGRFPVVIYAPGASDMSWENADLCEYLASFGYVVVATPSLGASTRSMTIDLAGADAQASDISFLLAFTRTLSDADTSATAVIGDSWGGIAGLFAAARDTRISGLVALDGSSRYYAGLLKRAGDVHPERMTTPFMYFMQGDFSLEDRDHEAHPEFRDGPNVFDAWIGGDLIIAHMLGLAHAAVTSMWQRNEDWWSECAICQPGDYNRTDAMTGYAWLARYTLAFMDAYLKRDPAALQFIKRTPAENGVPQHVMTIRYRAGSPIVRSVDDFESEIGRQGFARIFAIYEDFRKQQGGLELEEGALADWADELIAQEHPSEAIAVLRLSAEIHPDSSVAYMKLGDAYAIAGQEPLAKSSYETALAKFSNNVVVQRKLETLSKRSVAPQ